LRLIGETKVRAASLAQNASSSTHDDTARKLAELYIGSLAVHVGIDVALDSPTNAKGDCWRHLNSDPPCRSNIDPGRIAEFGISNCG